MPNDKPQTTKSEIERLLEARKFLQTVPKGAKVEIDYDFNQFQMIIELDHRLKVIETKLQKSVSANKQLIEDYEKSDGECYCDNVSCAYHLAKEAVQ